MYIQCTIEYLNHKQIVFCNMKFSHKIILNTDCIFFSKWKKIFCNVSKCIYYLSNVLINVPWFYKKKKTRINLEFNKTRNINKQSEVIFITQTLIQHAIDTNQSYLSPRHAIGRWFIFITHMLETLTKIILITQTGSCQTIWHLGTD